MSSIPIMTRQTSEFKEYMRNAATAAVTNTALSTAAVVLAVALVGMCAYTVHISKRIVAEKPLVVRVEKVGRAEAVNMQWDEYRPQDSDMKYQMRPR